MAFCLKFYSQLTRRKIVKDEDLQKTDLARCLTTLDLTALGVGSTLGAGAYVIAGQVAKSEAGPAVVISFLIAAVASVLAGLCYAEFGARVPKAGSAYVYTYVSVGEVLAFIIGWNLILEYVIGAASVARTASGYVDDLIGDILVPWFNHTMPMNVPTLAPYFDLLALGITLLLTIVLAVGVKESVMFTKVFTGLNLVILLYIIIAGAFKDDPNNWAIPPENVTQAIGVCSPNGGCGKGGFAPYGIAGITKGAATCFFAFVGFDAIATTGEEAKNPQKAIPLATVLSLGIVFAIYFGISLTITMMAPYFMLDSQAPFAAVFASVGWTVSKYIVSVGAICALTTSLLGSMFPLPRVVLAMARDGLVFKVFARVNARFKTPIIATLITGSLAAVMAALFDTHALVEMMSIGTLLAYTLVSLSVMLLRFDMLPEDEALLDGLKLNDGDSYSAIKYEAKQENLAKLQNGGVIKRFDGLNDSSRNIFVRVLKPNVPCPTPFTSMTVKVLALILVCWLTATGSMLKFGAEHIFIEMQVWAIALFIFLILMSFLTLLLINRQPQSTKKLAFTVPAVPFFPAGSMFFNIFLMLNLEAMTWGRFLIWMFIGFLIYFGYGIWHSNEKSSKSNHAVIKPEFGVHPSEVRMLDKGSMVLHTNST
jgi:cationic amino acid transport permease